MTESYARNQRKHTAAEHCGSNEHADRKLAVDDRDDADNQHDQRGQLLGRVGGKARAMPKMHVFTRSCRAATDFSNASLHSRLGPGRADRLDA